MTDHDLTELAAIEDRLRTIEKDVAIIKDARTRVSMPMSVLVVLWGMFLAMVAGVGFVVRVDTQVQDQWRVLSQLQATVNEHITQPWHAAAGEKYNAIDQRERALEDRMNQIQRERR